MAEMVQILTSKFYSANKFLNTLISSYVSIHILIVKN